ncbi:hypothetical protein SO694_00039014 [Aureococcus anophagefferens]|uniref:Uncharacterized protein n=1 Tax=Aureococcus anophagefferens TaxID=44056 RepID=A0ABR1FLG4_AURAN
MEQPDARACSHTQVLLLFCAPSARAVGRHAAGAPAAVLHPGRRRALSCAARLEPGLVIFNRLPWFESLAWSEVVSNQSAALDFEYLRWGGDRDVFRAAHAMDARDVGLSHGDGLRLAKTIREIQHRSLRGRAARRALGAEF